MAKHGQRLSRQEVEEIEAFREQGRALPDKYDRVVFDNATGADAFYRWMTADEERAADAYADRLASEQAAYRKRLEDARRFAPAGPLPPVPPVPGEVQGTAPREADPGPLVGTGAPAGAAGTARGSARTGGASVGNAG